MLNELHRTLFAVDDKSWRGKRATRRFSLISSSREEAEEEGAGENGWIEWEFTPDSQKLIQDSETYAVLNRQAVLGFRSAYALKLYEMGALRIHRRQSTWRGDMSAFRAALGSPPEVYSDFAQPFICRRTGFVGHAPLSCSRSEGADHSAIIHFRSAIRLPGVPLQACTVADNYAAAIATNKQLSFKHM